MRLLVLGGSVFLSRACVAAALLRGHDVTAACRGASGTVPTGARHVAWDRRDPVPPELARRSYDAVLDVARLPSWVRTSVATWSAAHHVLVSTINVYADETTPGGRPGALPLREARDDDVDLDEDPGAYGPMKVACEKVVRTGAASASIVHPGLVVGPGDPSGRFAFWPRRLGDAAPGGTREGEEVLAPGHPADVVQVIDVRDLAAWLVALAESRADGTWDGVGPPMPLGDLLAACADGVGAGAGLRWTWVDQDTLVAAGVEPWAGPRSVPLWLPRPAYDGMLAHDPTPSYDVGLTCRPVAETARDTLGWLDADPTAPVSGLDATREREVRAAFHRGVARG